MPLVFGLVQVLPVAPKCRQVFVLDAMGLEPLAQSRCYPYVIWSGDNPKLKIDQACAALHRLTAGGAAMLFSAFRCFKYRHRPMLWGDSA